MIGKRLAKLMADKEVGPLELAKSIKVHRNTIMDWKNNKYYPEVHNIIKLSKYFKVPASHFMPDQK